jgi:RNA polymerase sigma factor (sigma-70 family)
VAAILSSVTGPDSIQPGGALGAEEKTDVHDRAAEISRLFKEHNRTLVLYLAARLKDEQTAKEVAQEAYVKVLQLEKPGAIGFLRSYLFRVASNLAIDRLRQDRARARIDRKDAFEDFVEESMAERAALASDELAFLKRLIRELPPRYGQAFHLHSLQELSFEQIAGVMRVKHRMVRHYVALSLVYIRFRREGLSATEAWNRIHHE